MKEFSEFVAEMHDIPHFGNVCMLGMGISGIAVADFCLEALHANSEIVDGLCIYPGKDDEKNRGACEPFIAAGIEVVFDSEDVKGSYDTCVVSPGISANSGFYRSGKEASLVIMTEPEFAFRLSPEQWIGITGTNGKTTTTSLAAHLMRAGGIDALSVGNIGEPCITAVRKREPGTYMVAELSSYQLNSVQEFSPEVGVLLNITPDHLAWHGSHEAYIAAKMNMFANLTPDALAVVDLSDPGARRCADELVSRHVCLCGVDTDTHLAKRGRATICDGRICIWLPNADAPVMLANASDLAIKGEHNMADALAASTVALQVGADPIGVSKALLTFKPLEHRIEPCGVIDGVEYYNDSKATNTDAVLKALTAFGDAPLIVLLGGHDKGTDLDKLVAACSKRCKAVVCFGESRERFLEAFAQSDVQVIAAEHLKDALICARECAVPSDVILLSPACSSFDEFDGFEQRGRVFKGYVEEIQRG